VGGKLTVGRLEGEGAGLEGSKSIFLAYLTKEKQKEIE